MKPYDGDGKVFIEMECRECGFIGDELQDFITTGIPSERFCPECGSNQCYIVEEE